MRPVRRIRSLTICVVGLAVTVGAAGGLSCGESFEGTGGIGSSTSSPAVGSTSSGSTGTGGALPCGGGSGALPFCDENKNLCVACLADANCDNASAAHCDGGSCVACTASAECTHLAGTKVCDVGTCVECGLGDESACSGASTCDLVAKTCTGATTGSVQNCNTCTNDVQCVTGHRCIPMDFDGTAHGQFCLKEAMPSCNKPFSVFINRPSISGAAAVNYCGIDEDVVSCEAALSLLNSWQCGGTDGMCSPDGVAPEVATPGALCRQVGSQTNYCTYECGGLSIASSQVQERHAAAAHPQPGVEAEGAGRVRRGVLMTSSFADKQT